jgi:hypothetical protein
LVAEHGRDAKIPDSVGNPIAMGPVESLSHPGRNATGFSDTLADLSGKLVEIARDLCSDGLQVGPKALGIQWTLCRGFVDESR